MNRESSNDKLTLLSSQSNNTNNNGNDDVFDNHNNLSRTSSQNSEVTALERDSNASNPSLPVEHPMDEELHSQTQAQEEFKQKNFWERLFVVSLGFGMIVGIVNAVSAVTETHQLDTKNYDLIAAVGLAALGSTGQAYRLWRAAHTQHRNELNASLTRFLSFSKCICEIPGKYAIYIMMLKRVLITLFPEYRGGHEHPSQDLITAYYTIVAISGLYGVLTCPPIFKRFYEKVGIHTSNGTHIAGHIWSGIINASGNAYGTVSLPLEIAQIIATLAKKSDAFDKFVVKNDSAIGAAKLATAGGITYTLLCLIAYEARKNSIKPENLNSHYKVSSKDLAKYNKALKFLGYSVAFGFFLMILQSALTAAYESNYLPLILNGGYIVYSVLLTAATYIPACSYNRGNANNHNNLWHDIDHAYQSNENAPLLEPEVQSEVFQMDPAV